jgi:hypothetical protein
MIELDFLDETLDLNQTGSYHLSMQLGVKGFGYTILDTVRNKYVALRHYSFQNGRDMDKMNEEVGQLIASDEFLQKNYKSVYFLYPTQKFTLVPSPLFSKEQAPLFFGFNHEIAPGELIQTNRLKHTDAYLLFAVPGVIHERLINRYPSMQFFHQGFPLLESLLPHGSAAHSTACLCLNGDFLDICVTEKKKLRFYNTFSYTSEQDMLFFVLYVFEQLKLGQEDTELIACGDLSKTSDYYALLRKYIKRIRFDKPSDRFTYSYTFGSFSEHIFVTLFNLYACV